MKKLWFVLPALIVGIVSSCSTIQPENTVSNATNAAITGAPVNANNAMGGAKIEITEGGPADTVRAFYQKLREKKFREAIFMTNLRPAVEGLTDTELQDFSLDFEQLAGQVPAQLEINGEITTGAVTVQVASAPGSRTFTPNQAYAGTATVKVDIELEEVAAGRKPWAQAKTELAGLWRKIRGQILKDYVGFPLLSGLAGLARNRALLVFAACVVLFQMANASMLPLAASMLTLRSSHAASAAVSIPASRSPRSNGASVSVSKHRNRPPPTSASRTSSRFSHRMP